MGFSRGNWQVKYINRIVIPILTLLKLSAPNPAKWHKYVNKAQQSINNTPTHGYRAIHFLVRT